MTFAALAFGAVDAMKDQFPARRPPNSCVIPNPRQAGFPVTGMILENPSLPMNVGRLYQPLKQRLFGQDIARQIPTIGP